MPESATKRPGVRKAARPSAAGGASRAGRCGRQELLGLLEHEMRHNQGWARIHAADALLDHGQDEVVARCREPQAATAGLPCRVGVWRVRWRAAGAGPERAQLREAIRRVMLDPAAPDRLAAVETVAKLGLAEETDPATLQPWLELAGSAPAPFLHWLWLLSTPAASVRAHHEAALVRLLDAPEPVARLRAGFVLGRLPRLSPAARRRLAQHAEAEPPNSSARVYLLVAALAHAVQGSTAETLLVPGLARYLERGQPNEQLEAAVALGRRGAAEAAAALSALLNHPEPDARIGAASGLLYLPRGDGHFHARS
jgi:HEAT repeat protein